MYQQALEAAMNASIIRVQRASVNMTDLSLLNALTGTDYQVGNRSGWLLHCLVSLLTASLAHEACLHELLVPSNDSKACRSRPHAQSATSFRQ